VDEVTNVLISVDLILVIWDRCVFWLVLIDPCLPDLVVSLDLVLQLFEEHRVLIGELMLRESLQVQPLDLFHPWEDLVGVVNTSTHFEEEADIRLIELSVLNENLGGHHEFEGNLISFEETSADIPVYLVGKALDNVVHSVLNEVRFGRVVNTVIEQVEELLQ